jgi:hypothetical protein
MYEVVYYEGYETPPAFRVIGTVEGDTPEQALRQNLDALLAEVRDMYYLDRDSFADEALLDSLFVIREDVLLLAATVLRNAVAE